MTEVDNGFVILRDQNGNTLFAYEKEYVRNRIEQGEKYIDCQVRDMMGDPTGRQTLAKERNKSRKEVRIPPPQTKDHTGSAEYEYFGWDSSNISPKAVAAVIALLVLGGCSISFFLEKARLDKELKPLCEAGRFGNMVNGRGSGYMKYIWQGRVAVGNSSSDEYKKVENWFFWNCYDGW